MLQGGAGSDIHWCQRVMQKNHDASPIYHLMIGLCNTYNIMMYMLKKPKNILLHVNVDGYKLPNIMMNY
jgi:hypothetical protein